MSAQEGEGIDVVPASERTHGFWSLMAIWGGITIIVLNFLLGAAAFRAGVVSAIVAVTLSLVVMGVIVYAATYIAASKGTAGTTAMRAPFGIRGRVIPALALLSSTFLGFGILTGLLAGALQPLLAPLGVSVSVPVLAIVTGLVMAAFGVLGTEWIERLDLVAVPAMVLIVLWIVRQILANNSMAGILNIGGVGLSFWGALNIFPAATAAWLLFAMDFGRFGDAENPSRPAAGATIGAIIPAVLIGVIGVVAAAVVGQFNPVTIVTELGLGVIGLLFLIIGTWTTAVVNVYAGGVAFSQIVGVRRTYTSAAVGIGGTAAAALGIFSLGGIMVFLDVLNITLVPIIGIFFVHYFAVENGLDTDALFDTDGRYWYVAGFNPAAVLAWILAGAYAAVSGMLAPFLVPGLSGIVVAGVLYYGLSLVFDRWSASPTGTPSGTAD
jgi:purine-cytosine permease-like protein